MISPNPTDAGITISMKGELNQNWRFEMLDATGKILMFENDIAEPNKSFYLPRLIASGVYFIKIYLQNELIEKKIVVIR